MCSCRSEFKCRNSCCSCRINTLFASLMLSTAHGMKFKFYDDVSILISQVRRLHNVSPNLFVNVVGCTLMASQTIHTYTRYRN